VSAGGGLLVHMSTRVHLDRTPPSGVGAPTLDPEQRRVVEHRDGPLLVLAGPGTGKTTTLTEAIVSRLSDPDAVRRSDPQSVVALTFGRKAAAELRDRVQARLGGGLSPVVATFHSFAFALLRATASPEDFREIPRLLSGAEEDVQIRDLLVGSHVGGRITWPDDLVPGLRTLGLASEVRAVLARSRELGLDAHDLERIGRESGRPAWSAIGALALDVDSATALHNVIDYTDLLRLVINRLHEPDCPRPTFDAIYVDEYQDTDPLQVELLRALMSPGTSVVAVGDPDQAIYAFRGADRDGLLRFREQFRTSDGGLAPIVVLDRTRRFGAQIRAVATAVIERQGLPTRLIDDATRHRSPYCEGESRVEHEWYDSAAAMGAHIAEHLRRAHLDEQFPWSQMAVIVRAAHQIADVQHALTVAGVPVHVSVDELPLVREPAVAALIDAAEFCLAAASPAGPMPSERLASDVISGPLGDMDPSDLRRAAQAMRARAAATDPEAPIPTTAVVLRDALLDPESLTGLPDDPGVRALRALGALLADVTDRIERKAPPTEILWRLWTGTRWPQRLRQRALRGSTSADHDLDAVIALFDTAERMSDRIGGFRGIGDFIEILRSQLLPAEQVAELAADADRVRILTAHRAKGLEWEFVVVAGAQEGVWPDTRQRGSVLQADRLTPDGVGEPPEPGAVRAEEERLFYVAVTRARRRLLIAAVQPSNDGAAPPSRMLERVPVPPVVVTGRPARSSSLAGIIASLRSVAEDPAASPALRAAATARIARLAEETLDGRPLVPAAHPSNWWGVRDPSPGRIPVRPVDEPLRLSASAVESVTTCALRWFLDRQARVEVPRNAAIAFGSIIHAIAEHVGSGDVPADLDAADDLLDLVWSTMAFDAPFTAEAERVKAREALRRFLDYHTRDGRTLMRTEAGFSVPFDTPSGPVDVRGSVDRLEMDSRGALVPVDLKTGKKAFSKNEVAEHVQLAVYQWAVTHGAFADLSTQSAGAALVLLRVPVGTRDDGPKVQEQAPAPELRELVEEALVSAAETIRTEDFAPTPGAHCRNCAYLTLCPTGPGEVIR